MKTRNALVLAAAALAPITTFLALVLLNVSTEPAAVETPAATVPVESEPPGLQLAHVETIPDAPRPDVAEIYLDPYGAPLSYENPIVEHHADGTATVWKLARVYSPGDETPREIPIRVRAYPVQLPIEQLPASSR